MDIGKKIKERRCEIGMSAEQLADKIGVSPATMYRWESGDVKKVSADIVPALCKALRIMPAELFGIDAGRTGRSTRPLQILGVICAGDGICTDQGAGETVMVDSRMTGDCGLIVHGDSMTGAGIFDGDIAFLEADCDVVDGNIYAVVVGAQSEASLKTVFHECDKLVLWPSNVAYRPQRVDERDAYIVGRLCGVYHIVDPK